MYGVLGAPRAGKSTFCAGLTDILEQISRPHVTVNLDPTNDFVQYTNATYDIKKLITVKTLWTGSKILDNKDKYIIIDCPGQLELSEGELWKANAPAEEYRPRQFANFTGEEFPALAEASKQGKYPVLRYPILGGTLCYEFEHLRTTTRGRVVYRCTGCRKRGKTISVAVLKLLVFAITVHKFSRTCILCSKRHTLRRLSHTYAKPGKVQSIE
ncbi:hypothetical protein GCK32_007688 [Trichostrongylus colubriformis]|uniref:GPN-loop GTPase 2 n=1 Tax=Trichostrongylus colubriformis TaxID=6319 RepID=A0AAN8FUQ5_TRICO